MYNDDSFEKKDIELEDIYESDNEDMQMGIPAGLAMDHMMKENILLTLFNNMMDNNNNNQL